MAMTKTGIRRGGLASLVLPFTTDEAGPQQAVIRRAVGSEPSGDVDVGLEMAPCISLRFSSVEFDW
jgi:hypothetical protein